MAGPDPNWYIRSSLNFGGKSKARRWGLSLVAPVWLWACSSGASLEPVPDPPELPAHCMNGRRDPMESGVDCGGDDCARCGTGDTCIRASDCAQGVCRDGACQDARCGNEKLDVGESDVDCGGTLCQPCETDRVCAGWHDCASSSCVDGRCAAPACDDEILNGDEQDVDCGGSCVGCQPGALCQSASDCESLLCEDGRCSHACPKGSADCDGDYANGCETDTTKDPLHCGACAKPCDLSNAEPECVGGACRIQSCAAGFSDCNGEAGDGCEVDIARDPKNCGACDDACSENHAVADCRDGRCALTCEPGFDDCDHDDTTGCEVSIATDGANCGRCGSQCNAGAVCSAGECTPR